MLITGAARVDLLAHMAAQMPGTDERRVKRAADLLARIEAEVDERTGEKGAIGTGPSETDVNEIFSALVNARQRLRDDEHRAEMTRALKALDRLVVASWDGGTSRATVQVNAPGALRAAVYGLSSQEFYALMNGHPQYDDPRKSLLVALEASLDREVAADQAELRKWLDPNTPTELDTVTHPDGAAAQRAAQAAFDHITQLEDFHAGSVDDLDAAPLNPMMEFDADDTTIAVEDSMYAAERARHAKQERSVQVEGIERAVERMSTDEFHRLYDMDDPKAALKATLISLLDEDVTRELALAVADEAKAENLTWTRTGADGIERNVTLADIVRAVHERATRVAR